MSLDHFPSSDSLSGHERLFLIVDSVSVAVVVCSTCPLVVISSGPVSPGLGVSVRLLPSVSDFVGSGPARGGRGLRGRRSLIVPARSTKDKKNKSHHLTIVCK